MNVKSSTTTTKPVQIGSILLFCLAAPTACGSSQARDRTRMTAVTIKDPENSSCTILFFWSFLSSFWPYPWQKFLGQGSKPSRSCSNAGSLNS